MMSARQPIDLDVGEEPRQLAVQRPIGERAPDANSSSTGAVTLRVNARTWSGVSRAPTAP